MTTTTETQTRFKLWHIPQIPMAPFTLYVDTLEEGALILYVLAKYDDYEFTHQYKPDYSNAAGLMAFDEEFRDWSDWENEDGDFDAWTDQNWSVPKRLDATTFVKLLNILHQYDSFQWRHRVKRNTSSAYDFLKNEFQVYESPVQE